MSHLKNKLKLLALLDAINCQEWQFRFFSYDSTWSNNEEIASYRNESGDEAIYWFKDNLFGYFTKTNGIKPIPENAYDSTTYPEQFSNFKLAELL